MKFSSMMIATALALSGTANAADENSRNSDVYVDNMVDCISDFIVAELDNSVKDAFIAECMQAKMARTQQPAATNIKG